nr:uncharacterized protein LOC127303587 [Lolium perenne]
MKNWLHHPKDDKESIRIAGFIDTNKEETNLCAEDLVRAFLARRVLPLQRRAHKISQMSGPMDPTRITTHRLSSSDLVLKAKQICQNPLSPSGKYGLAPYSRNNSPPPREEPASFTPDRIFRDDCDADPFVKKHKMGPTHTKLPGNFPTPLPANDSGSDDEVTILEILPQPTPTPRSWSARLRCKRKLARSSLDNLASRGRKNKAPTPEASPSRAPPAKRSKKGGGGKPYSTKRYRGQMPACSEHHPERTGQEAGSLRGRHQDLNSPSSKSDTEDTGASNIGAGKEVAERAEPPVPPSPKKKKKAATSPAKTMPETSAPASSPPAKEAPEAPAPSKDAPAPPLEASTGKPAHPGGAPLTAQQLDVVVTAATAPPSGSQALTLHAGRAAVTASDKASAQLGRITELSRGEVSLGPLQAYAEKWNLADLSPKVSS